LVSSSDIGFNRIYLDFAYSFIGKFTLSKDSISQFPPLTLDLIGFIWIMFIPLSVKFTLSKDSISQFPPLTLDLIGCIWIMFIPLSENSPFQKIRYHSFPL